MGGNEDAYNKLDTGLSIVSVGIITMGMTYSVSSPSNNKLQNSNNSPIKNQKPFSQQNFRINGGTQTRFYDYKGNASLDIDFSVHSAPNAHANPHFHIWDYNEIPPRSKNMNRW